MSQLLLVIFLTILVYAVFQGLKKPENFLQYPNLFASCFLLFIGIQTIIVVFNPVDISSMVTYDKGVELLIITLILCVIMGIWGYEIGVRWRGSRSSTTISDTFLLCYGIALVVVGWYGAYKMAAYFGGFSRQFFEGAHYTVWEGEVVQYNFFVSFMYPGLFMIFFSTVMNFNYKKFFILCLASIYPLMVVLILGRRYQMLYLALMVLSCFALLRNCYLKRSFMIFGYISAFTVLLVAPVYRTIHLNPNAEPISIKTIVYSYFEEGKGAEVKAALTAIAGSNALGKYNYGLSIYDMFVFNYVPASIFGPEVKISFLTGINDEISMMIAARYGEDKDMGTFRTGPGSVFMMFGFFGAFLYLLQGWWYGRLWTSIKQNPDNDFIKLQYGLMLPAIFLGVVFCFEQVVIYMFQVTIILIPLYCMRNIVKKGCGK